jgi:hypothetical protein
MSYTPWGLAFATLWRNGRALIWLVALFLVSTGCSALSLQPKVRPPSVSAVSSPYTSSLYCLGRLLARYYGSTFQYIVAPRTCHDATRGPVTGKEETPWEFCNMALAALGCIRHGLKVSEVLLLPQWERDDKLRPNSAMRINISTHDLGTILSGWKWETNAGPFEKLVQALNLELERQRATSPITVDVTIFDHDKGILKDGAQSSVGVILRRESLQWDGALALFMYLTVGLSTVKKEVEGVGEALRALVDVGVLQAISRQFRLPYNRCLDIPLEDPWWDELIRHDFSAKPASQQGALIRELLRDGYGLSIKPQGLWNAEVEAGLAQVKSRFNLHWPPGDRGRAYRELYYHLPLTSPTR